MFFRHRLAPIVLFLAIFLPRLLFAQAGGLDSGFNAGTVLNGTVPGTVRVVKVLSSGKSLIAGEFTTINGNPRGSIALLNSDGSLDPDFNGTANGIIHAILVQADGKILIGGEFTKYNGVSRNRIARLSSIGALDTSFNPGTGFDGPVYALTGTQSLYAGGDFSTFNGVSRNRIAQLAFTGALFPTNITGGANGAVYALITVSEAIGGSTSLYAGGAFTTFGGVNRNRLAKVTSATVDSTFNASGGPNGPVYSLAFMGSSNSSVLYFGGDFTSVGAINRGRIARWTTTQLGASPTILDPAFNFSIDGICRSLAVTGTLSNPQVYAGGDFTNINGQLRSGIARLSFILESPIGTTHYWNLDNSYGSANGVNGTVYQIEVANDGKALAGGAFTTFAGVATPPVVRLYSDTGNQLPAAPGGLVVRTLSNTQIYAQWSASLSASTYTLERSADGVTGWNQIYTGANTLRYENGLIPGTTYFYRVTATNSNGSSAASPVVSASTNPTAWKGAGAVEPLPAAGFTDGVIYAIVPQPDGKILLGGSFKNVLGVARQSIARLLPDRTLDPSFNPGTGPDYAVNRIALLRDGRIYIQGSFGIVSGVNRAGLARLHADGSLDPTFNAGNGASGTYDMVIGADDRLLVTGSFSGFDGGFNGTGHYNLVRLNLDGSVDLTYNVGLSTIPSAIALQSDGRLLITSFFGSANGIDFSGHLARLNADGSLDTDFKANITSILNIIALQNGGILVTTYASGPPGSPRNGTTLLNADGTPNPAFSAPAFDGTSELVVAQPDGKFIVAGSFMEIGNVTRWKLARFNADGSVDATFDPGAGPGSGSISAMAVLGDTGLLVAGSFTSFGESTHDYLVYLKGDGNAAPPPAVEPLLATSPSSSSLRLSWKDGAGEFSYHLERSLDGVGGWNTIADLPWDSTTFTDTGRIAGTEYFYRLRASNSAGNSPFSANLAGRTLSLYSQWKLDYGFSTTEPDSSDGDGDGVSTLMEYALGLDPTSPQFDGLPVNQLLNGALALSYRRFRSDVLYLVETSTDLKTWTTVGVTQGAGPFPIAWTLTGNASQKYLRLKVTVP
ncbi:MAG: hypothetical protein JWL90_2940 [Chthoniobacteraceae bacterium]|nr:hypothetical protein [Chthoniobacteraceae bacterium]